MPEIDVSRPPEGQRGKCPTCNQLRLWVGPNKAFNALSRRDNETYICSPCGMDEALADMAIGAMRRRCR